MGTRNNNNNDNVSGLVQYHEESILPAHLTLSQLKELHTRTKLWRMRKSCTALHEKCRRRNRTVGRTVGRQMELWRNNGLYRQSDRERKKERKDIPAVSRSKFFFSFKPTTNLFSQIKPAAIPTIITVLRISAASLRGNYCLLLHLLLFYLYLV